MNGPAAFRSGRKELHMSHGLEVIVCDEHGNPSKAEVAKGESVMSKSFANMGLTLGLVLAVALVSCGSTEEAGSSRSFVVANAGSMAAPPLLPPNSQPFGHSYGEWAQQWNQWAFSMPVEQHPLFDTAPCGTGQTGNVWFLGGSFVTATPSRSCTVPAGTAVFFPVINNECSGIENNLTSEADLSACASQFRLADVFCEIDGVPVPDAMKFLLTSPRYQFGPLPDGNILQFLGLDAPAGTTTPSVTYGVYALVRPLTPGKHSLHFGGTFPDFAFSIDIKYALDVE
jgi:hypothetical protein